MKVGKMDGFCVGEPWNARAIADGIGYTAITTQQIWKDHPEKVLAFTEEFAEKNPKTVKAVLRAMLESSQHIDKLENRPHMAEVVSRPQYINTQKEIILGRMLGDYDYGDGRKGKGSELHDVLCAQHQFPLEIPRRLVALPISSLGHGEGSRRTIRVSSIKCIVPTYSARCREGDGDFGAQGGHAEGNVCSTTSSSIRASPKSTPRSFLSTTSRRG